MKKVIFLLGGLLLFSGAVSLIRSTAAQGTDFYVFWNAARAVFYGEPLYSISRDGGMVFKYPPWILPFFFPFGWMSLEAAKWIWGLIEVGSLLFIVYWLHQNLKIKKIILFFLLVLFWGIWIIHALDGQVALPMLALALGCQPLDGVTEKPSLKLGVLCADLSTKIFTLFPLLHLKWSIKSWKAILSMGALFCLLSLPALWSEPSHSPVHLMKSWIEASTSAGKNLDARLVRGKRNPGLPGYVAYLLHVPAEKTIVDISLALFFALSFGFIWKKASRSLASPVQWVGWLALTPVVHPLPWWHLFAFCFPLAVYVTHRVCLPFVSRLDRFVCGLGLVLLCLSSEKVFGSLGIQMELNAAKSWGVLLLLSLTLRFKKVV